MDLSLILIHPPYSLGFASFTSGRLRLEPSLEKEMVPAPLEFNQLYFYQKIYHCLVINKMRRRIYPSLVPSSHVLEAFQQVGVGIGPNLCI